MQFLFVKVHFRDDDFKRVMDDVSDHLRASEIVISVPIVIIIEITVD